MLVSRMWPFKKNSQAAQIQKRERRPHVVRNVRLKTKELIERARLNALQTNPDLLNKVALHQAGYDEFISEVDPIEQAKRKVIAEGLENDPAFREQVRRAYARGKTDAAQDLNSSLEEAAIDKIKNNPALMDKVVEKRISKIVGGGDGKGSFLEEYRKFKEFEEALGVEKKNGGGLANYLTPEVVTGILQIIPAIIGRPGLGQGNPQLDSPPSTVASLPAAATSAPISTQMIPLARVVPRKETINLSSWLPFLDGEPQAIVEDLRSKASMEGEEADSARYTIKLLQENDYDSIIKMLVRFKDKGGDIEKVITTLESRREWLEKVMSLLKEPVN